MTQVVYEKLRPTFTHEAIAELVAASVVQNVVTLNVDGLHRLTGIARKRLHQLRGAYFLEQTLNLES